jgi:ribonuclease VapC
VIALDSSALLAIAFAEPEREAFATIIRANYCIIGTPTVQKCHMVLRERQGADGVEFLDSLLARRQVALVGFDDTLLSVARLAFDRYGRGRHRAGLNFGDCMAYAVAKARNVALLFKGDDFRHTDILSAAP